MKRNLLLFVCLLNAVWASAQYSGSGNGTEDDPYLIYNETQLYQMNNFLGDDHAGVVFKLMKDLDLTDFIGDNFPSEGWMPVGVESTPFEGKFYGNNHKISGLWISRTTTNNVGLFGYITKASIQDLSLEESSIKAQHYVGSVVGYSVKSTITNCSATASSGVSGKMDIAGIAGHADSTAISQCNYNGVVTVTDAGPTGGGIVGAIKDGSVSSCNVTGTINGTSKIGGIAGAHYSADISDCSISAVIKGTSEVGGVIGHAESTFSISNAKYVGEISGTDDVAGVIALLTTGSSATITNCHSKGKITNTGNFTGGIVGESDGACIAGMENCSHFGDIQGVDYVGGLIGGVKNNKVDAENIYISTTSTENTKTVSKPTFEFVTGTDELLVNNCVAIGNITGSLYVGGLVGWDEKAFVCSNWDSGGNATIERYANGNQYSSLWWGDTYTGKEKRHSYNTQSFSPNIRINTIAYTNSYYSGIINGTDNVGGIAGYKWCGRIQNCYTNATVYGSNNIGGIIGNAEGYSTSQLTLKSNVAINNTISATVANIGRIYGTQNDQLTIGALASAEGNRALTTTKVIKQGVVQEVIDDFQNGNVMGKSLLKLKANYVALGWDFDNNWDILETECIPYKKYQAAPPVIESELVSQNTEISGSSFNGGTVYLYYKNRDAVSTVCSANSWTFPTSQLQSGASVQLYADVEGMTPSYLTSATVGYLGTGTEADPYRIYTADDLQGASNKGYYKLMNDIDLTSWINENSPAEGWVSIGRNSGEATYINGDGHKVTGLWINTTQDYTGLFSNFSAGIIKNLNVEVAKGKSVKGGDYTGILIGRNANGQLLNCTVKGDVEGTVHVGGVVGYSGNNTVNSVTFEGNVRSASASAYVGGFAGLSENDATTAVHSYSAINATETNCFIGGAIGYMNGGSMTKSHSESTVTAAGDSSYVGGLIGYSKGDVSLSYSAGTVTATGENSCTGGLVGYAYSPIANCYSTATTTGTYYVAGICAYSYSTIDKCYAKGDVFGTRYGGGVVAQLDGPAAGLTNSIAANSKLELTDQSSWGSRVIGGFKNGASEPDDSNYALSTMQVSLNGVAQKKTDDAVEGIAKDATTLMTSLTYMDLGWDYTNVWGIDEGEIYPYLLWEVDINPVADISLDNTSLIIAVSNSATLQATVLPLGATNKRLAWTTSDSNVATVEDGIVTAVAQGSAIITASATDGSGVSAQCSVTVVANHDDAIAELQSIVDRAQALYDNSTEGDEIGQYAAGSRAALLTVINNVRSQISSTMDLEAISDCTSAINEAITAFNAKKVTAGEDTDIADYDNILYLDKEETSVGNQFTYSLKMKNAVDIAGFQVDIYLPDGVTFAFDEDDFPMAELSSARTSSKKTDYFNAVQQADGALRLLCSSTKGYAFEGTDGEVATFTINVSKDMENGDYPVILRKMEMSEKNSQSHKVEYFKSTLTISSYTLGDANADGDITVSDFTAIANHILGSTPKTFIEKAADVNLDGDISVSDLTGVANIILYGSPTGPASVKEMNAKGQSDVIVRTVVPQVVSVVSNKVTVPVSIQNIGTDFSAFQFDVLLPDGLTMSDVVMSTERTDLRSTDFFAWRQLDNGMYRVICASTRGCLFTGNDGCVANMSIEASDMSFKGMAEVTISNVEISRDAKSFFADGASSIVTFDSASGIDEVNGKAGEAGMDKYNPAGQRVDEGYKGVIITEGIKRIVK